MTLTERAAEVGEELRFIQRQLGRLAWQRSFAAFSPAEHAEYGRLSAREKVILGIR